MARPVLLRKFLSMDVQCWRPGVIIYVYVPQVAAQTGHNVVLVDMSDDLLAKSTAAIKKSLGRVVKKKFAAEPEVSTVYTDRAVVTSTDMQSVLYSTT